MKNVLTIIILMSGFFTLTDAVGQANCNPANCKPADCTPCPPGCCIYNCCTSNGAVAATSGQAADVVYAALLAENGKPSTKGCKMSRKETKACMTACKASQNTTVTGCRPAPACENVLLQTTTASVSHVTTHNSKVNKS